MSNVSLNVPYQLPEHFGDYYPKFIQFLELYYVYLHREKGFSSTEINRLLENQDWYNIDIDKFVQTGDSRYFGSNAGHTDIQTAIVERSHILPAGAISDRLMANQLLERQFDSFQDSDGEYLETSDENIIDVPFIDENVLNSWFKSFGFLPVGQKNSIDSYDPVSLLNVLKSMYRVKGTRKCAELFFLIFFNEEIEGIYLPKDDIARIDDNFIPDYPNYLRDDVYYNEYTYVIQVLNDVEQYSLLFETIYKKLFHPAGFAVYIEQIAQATDIPYYVTMKGILYMDEPYTNYYIANNAVSTAYQLVAFDGSYLVTYDNAYKYSVPPVQ